MNRDQAVRSVRETLESPFDRARFAGLIRNLLNKYEEAEISRTGNFIPAPFQQHIAKYERLGKYIDGEGRLDILVVHLKREASIERARSMQRNFIAGYLQGRYGTDSVKDAALVAFVSPATADWRFSLVKLEIRLEATGKGRLKPIDAFTPVQRWSFLVGKNEKSHTAQSRLVPMMMDDERSPTLLELEDAFNIETVTKEFFEKYRDLFVRTKQELDKAVAADKKAKAEFDKNGIDSVNMAKKLLGQIVFLYFLQKKGWLGVPRDAEWGQGSRSFLRDLFAKAHGDFGNFFNDILEPLFYEALRIDRSHDHHYYSRFNCKIPFLNGGLFDPMGSYDWVKTDIRLPDKLFSNTTKTREGDSGDGILDTFDRYNFTVREDEPYEKEVAIDPELLGKAYEKFNAIRPDNFSDYLKALKGGNKAEETRFNRQYGVYYTPRPIVHYMCQQSLINYLVGELEGAVAKDDFATLVQSGERLQEHEAQASIRETSTYSSILPESIRESAHLIDQKLADIRVCDPAVGSGAFPVGMMNEIVKSRQLLSTFTKENTTVYDLKRQCIETSLYGVDVDAGAVEIAKLRLWLSLVVDEDDPRNIKPLPNLDYKIVRGDSLLGFPMNWGTPIQKEIDSLIRKHFDETNPTRKAELKALIDEQLANRYKTSLKTFGYHVDFDFKAVFSAVFQEKAGFDVVIGNPPYGARIGKDTLNRIRPLYPTSIKGKVESYRIFIERGMQITRPNGILCYIVPNTWMFLEQAVLLRLNILQNTSLNTIVSLPQTVFEATVDSIAFLLRMTRPGATTVTEVFEVPLRESVARLGHYLQQGTNYVQSNWLESEKATITYGQNALARNLILKLRANHPTFGDYIYIRQGLIPYLTKKDGARNRFISPSRVDKSWSEYLDGSRCVDRYHIKGKVSYVKYGNWLYAPREAQIFSRPRIIYQLIRNISLKKRIVATYLDGTLYSDRNTGLIFIKPDVRLDLKYVLGVLNSTLANYVHSKTHNSTYISFPSIEALPLAIGDAKAQARVSTLVDRVLTAKGVDSKTNTGNLELEIDEMVYQLYGLTAEEIRTVEET